MAQKAIVKYFRNLLGNEAFTFHCFRKSTTRYIVYGRQEGRPSLPLEKMLAKIELSTIDKYKVLSYSYDRDNTCLCITLERSPDNVTQDEAPSALHRKAVSPRARLRSISDCFAFGAVPILSYETAMNKYYAEGNYKLVLEVYDAACKSNLQPSLTMVKTRDIVLTFLK